ncbi:MAG: ADP-ribosylglycohydrolase family protein [Planctomycetota bacterium]
MRTKHDRARDAILGSFLADAAALGLHWIYDQDEVRAKGGDHPEFFDPAGNQYHARRKVGEFTHYGDHALVALESVAESGGLDVEDYLRRYMVRFGDSAYDGWLDHATKDLLKTKKGADDNQAGAFVKLPILVARYLDDPEFEARIEEAIRVTHDNTQAVRYGVAAACAIRAAILGGTAEEAVDSVCKPSKAIEHLLVRVLESDADMAAFALEAGQTCPVPNSLPTALHEALHGGDFENTVRGAILSGGDTSGRLFVSAAIRGATDGISDAWWQKVAARERIEALTERVLGAERPKTPSEETSQ